ncbi:MAG: LysM peptidoglycan-binding domain-containing protein [Negativicutes bacterium]|nr:LysM peptidoglycan-binding domain-containing protein [Negativicutes bacterium]
MNFRDELNLYRKQAIQMRILIIFSVVALAVVSLGADQAPGVMQSEVYTVSPGDTLWDISSSYIDRNTHGSRDIREFYHGIIEGNWQVFEGRQRGAIQPGDKLTITWWG